MSTAPHPLNNKIAAPELMSETATVDDLCDWSDFLGIPASAIFRAAQQLVGGDAEGRR